MKGEYLFISTDEYLIKKKIDELLKKENIDEEILEMYDLDEADLTDLISCLNTESVFDDKRVFWVKNPSILEGDKEISKAEFDMLESYAKSENTNILIFSSTNYNKSNKLSPIIKQYFNINELDKLDINLGDYFNKYVMDNHMLVDEAIKLEVLNRSKDYQTLENNLEKLYNYSNGEAITMDMVNLLINKEVESKIYDISQAMFEGDTNKAYISLKNLLDENVSPSIILANLKNTITLLLYVSKLTNRGKSQYDIARDLNISAGRTYHLMRSAKTLGDKRIEDYISRLYKINIDSRSGSGDEKLLLELFVLQK